MESFQHVLGYPECKNAKPIVETIEEPCPKCGGVVQVRKSKKRRKYYICENNPKSCDYISWNKPKKGEVISEEAKIDLNEEEKVTKKKKTTTRKKASNKK